MKGSEKIKLNKKSINNSTISTWLFFLLGVVHLLHVYIKMER